MRVFELTCSQRAEGIKRTVRLHFHLALFKPFVDPVLDVRQATEEVPLYRLALLVPLRFALPPRSVISFAEDFPVSDGV